MGLPQAKTALQALKVELDALTNLFDKYNLLINIKKYAENQIKQTSEDIKNAPPPTTLSELKTYYITDELFNRYTVDAAGNLTKVL